MGKPYGPQPPGFPDTRAFCAWWGEGAPGCAEQFFVNLDCLAISAILANLQMTR
jgi:hypothetical protein